MAEERAGKQSMMLVLDILKKYSDCDHKLSQREISERISREYGVMLNPKAVKRNIISLLDAGYDIDYIEVPRMRGGEEQAVMTDFYLHRDFEDYELLLLINSVMCSAYIPPEEAQLISSKLRSLSNVYFTDKAGSIAIVNSAADQNQEYEGNIEKLNEAIQEGRQVTFKYATYMPDKKLHLKEKDGVPRVYTVNPYRVVSVEGRTYLICNTQGKLGVSNYRVDKMKGLEKAETPARPAREMPELSAGLLDLPRYLSEHMHMSFRNPGIVEMRFRNGFANVVIDTFGTRVEISGYDEETSIARFRIDLDAMCTWAMQYPEDIEVLSPPELVDNIRKKFEAGMKKYSV